MGRIRTIVHTHATPEQLASLQHLPSWQAVRGAGRRCMSAALTALACSDVEELQHLSNEELCRRLGSDITRRHVRYGMSLLMRGLGRTWDMKYSHAKAELKLNPRYPMSAEQMELARSFGYDSMGAQARMHLRIGITLLKASSLSDLQNIPKTVVQELLTNEVEIYCARRVLRMAGRTEIFHGAKASTDVRITHGELHLTVWEKQWLEEHPEASEAFKLLKWEFMEWIRREHGDNKRLQDMVCRGMRVYCHLPAALRFNLKVVSKENWTAAAAEAAAESIEHPKSLVSMRRQSRQGPDARINLPGYNCSRILATSLKLLHQHLQIPDTVTPSRQCIWRMVQQQQSSRVCDMVPVHDVLSANEMERFLGAAASRKERVIALLLCRHGMRIGAIRKLRLSGIVENVAPLQDWSVRRFISGVDKNGQLNTWDTLIDPQINEEMMLYLKEEWKPRWEAWVGPALKTAWLFPAHRYHSGKDKPMGQTSLRSLVNTMLQRASITGHHAHAHAFRKGVVTLLLKQGNPLHVVSRFVHHKSTAVTEKSYDKRTYEEVTEQMRVPMQWEKQQPEVDCDDPMPADADATSTTHSAGVSTTYMVATSALLDEMNLNDDLRRRIKLLKSMLPPERLREYEETVTRMEG